ncbi:MAG: sugar transferase [bacterium]
MGLSLQTTEQVNARRRKAAGRATSKDEGSSLCTLKQQLYRLFLQAHPAVQDIVEERVDFSTFAEFDAEIVDTDNLPQVRALRNHYLRLFVNMHRINDMRWLNKYFLTVHEHLRRGGIFIGMGDTLEIRKDKFFKRYPPFVAPVLFVFNFFYARIMPKLPGLKKVYFTLSQGQNRALSKAEILGRLSYCGFKILAITETGDNFYFIAKKDRAPSTDKNPSYGFIIKLRRIGRGGKPIYIRKFRTMHPYSEYLQEYVFEQNHLQLNGKFKDDFRITSWGRVMRKYWLDELPQLFNYIKGDIKLVGPRALSEHYLTLYPKQLQALREEFKPGLIPPYYVDLPQSFDEIIESEKRYFERKLKHRFLTDDIYFCRAMFNILIRRARSV